MTHVTIDGKAWHSNRRDEDQEEAEGIMKVAAMVNGQLHGYQRGRTARVELTDKNVCHEDVNDHAEWLLKLQREGNLSPGVKIVDRRTQR